MKSPKSYQPISCHFYDELEALATRKVKCVFSYLNDDGQLQMIDGYICDFSTVNKEEFMQLDNGDWIRLDQIVRVNDLNPKDEKYI